MKNPVVVDLGLANLTLNTFLSETVNEISEVYLFVNIPMLLATIAVNIWVIKEVEEKRVEGQVISEGQGMSEAGVSVKETMCIFSNYLNIMKK